MPNSFKWHGGEWGAGSNFRPYFPLPSSQRSCTRCRSPHGGGGRCGACSRATSVVRAAPVQCVGRHLGYTSGLHVCVRAHTRADPRVSAPVFTCVRVSAASRTQLLHVYKHARTHRRTASMHTHRHSATGHTHGHTASQKMCGHSSLHALSPFTHRVSNPPPYPANTGPLHLPWPPPLPCHARRRSSLLVQRAQRKNAAHRWQRL
jgi:hypothetical protein